VFLLYIYTHLLLPGAELPLVESFGPLNDLFPFPWILDAGYPVLDLHIYTDLIIYDYLIDMRLLK